MAMEKILRNGNGQRIDFGTIPTVVGIPNLIEIQLQSYERLLQSRVSPNQREDEGLENVFQSVFPISDFNGTAYLNYVGYEIGTWTSESGDFKGLGGPVVVDPKSKEPLTYRPKNEVEACRER